MEEEISYPVNLNSSCFIGTSFLSGKHLPLTGISQEIYQSLYRSAINVGMCLLYWYWIQEPTNQIGVRERLMSCMITKSHDYKDIERHDKKYQEDTMIGREEEFCQYWEQLYHGVAVEYLFVNHFPISLLPYVNIIDNNVFKDNENNFDEMIVIRPSIPPRGGRGLPPWGRGDPSK